MRKAKKSNGKTKTSLPRAIIKLGLYLIAFMALLLVGGFIVFANSVARLAPPSPLPKVDGIVVLTGADGSRLQTGAQLLRQKQGERLLISGVNKNVPAEKIRELLGLDTALFECCVDLGYEAQNTYGNGREAASWAHTLGYESILLVSSAYHMPRATSEFKSAMGDILIIPYPTHTQALGDKWWRNKDIFRLYLREFGKLLVSFARDPGHRPG